ncbi:uncharacterized protein LOC128389531 [Panonychus citri]|uniref:uncharacterized protein LOC128389531 n=1 Tax=Panonychus citri TaxID=50023 RepID=UPI002306F315|nr:uncharacterized protein LOC128389531 [Panonychus citri]
MLFTSNYKIVLFFIFNSVFLTVNAGKLVKHSASTTDVAVKTDEAASGDTSEAKNVEPKAETTTVTPIEVDPRVPISKLEKTADDHVIISTDILPKFKDFKVAVKIEYEIEVSKDKWEKGEKRSDPVRSERISAKAIGKRGFLEWKVGPLKPNTHYRFFVYSVYNKQQFPEQPPIALETTTKLTPPKSTILKGVSVLPFGGTDVKSYYVQINKVKEDAKEADCFIEIKMSPDFGKELTLPELTAGKKYTIKTWYISKDDKESESVITELIA